MQDLISEPMGFRYTVGGFSAWLFSLLNNVDITQVIGFVGLLIGLAIQIASWRRNRKADRLQDEADRRAKESDDRDREADARDIKQYDLQMKILAKQLADIEKGENGVKS